jgi:hypothetical protein
MATTRPFAYYTGSPISGTEQLGSLAIGTPQIGFYPTSFEPFYGRYVQWWNGPDEELGYVICKPIPLDNQPTSVPGDNLFLSTTYKATDISLSNNNQTATQVFSYQQSVLGETLISSTDKVMFSVKFTSTNPSVGVGGRFIGMGSTSMNYQGNPFGGYPGNDNHSTGFSDDGKLYYNGQLQWSGLPTWTSGDIIDIAVDGVSQQWWIRVNGGYWCNDDQADPITNIGGFDMTIGDSYPVLCPYIYGKMEILNLPKYGSMLLDNGWHLSGYNFLGKTTASVGFLRSSDFTEISFVNLVNSKFSQSFSNGTDCKNWLNNNGYWTSYVTPVLSLDAANYTSGNWVDSVGGKQFTLYNNPSWSSSNGGYFNFNSVSSQYAESNTSLPTLFNWSVGVWHYYDGTNSNGSPCIVTEVYPSAINYVLGNGTDSSPNLQVGFYNGSFHNTPQGYQLTPGNWYYIVGTYDGSNINLYVNNTLIYTQNDVSVPISGNSGILLMKRWDYGQYWGGKLATVDIYDKAINQGHIDSIWNSTKSRFGL